MSTRVRLGSMMCLQFFVWGVFFVTMGTYLTKLFADQEGLNEIVGQTYATQTWAALFAPLIVGYLGDRLMNKEQLNGILHLIGGGAVQWSSALWWSTARGFGACTT